jgi:hypothetical protein
VHVDEAGADIEAVGVDRAVGRLVREPSDRFDPIARDADVG